jgi:hypothetical protein
MANKKEDITLKKKKPALSASFAICPPTTAVVHNVAC